MSDSIKLTAKDRVLCLLDDNSFVEIGAFVTKRNTDFNLGETGAPGDGVITGYGTVNGFPVFVYSQDAAVLNGSLGEMHARKISRVYELAVKVGAPIVGILDCSGMRLKEGTDAMEAFGEVFAAEASVSGMVPQIACVVGECGGASAVSASLCDFVLATKDAKIYINKPDAVAGNNMAKCDTSAPCFKASVGDVDFVFDSEEELFNGARKLMGCLPSSNSPEENDPSQDDLNRSVSCFDENPADVEACLREISDNGFYIEPRKDYAADVITAFIKLNGETVGVVANNGALSAKGADKAAGFVSFCDSFNIELLTIVDVAGVDNSECSERHLANRLAKLTKVIAEATVPKVCLVKGNAFGTAGIIMNSRSIGADLVYALEGAKIGPMPAKLAAQIVFADELKAENGGEASLNKYAAKYEESNLNATAAAKRGVIDDIITGADVRKQLIYAFEMLYYKEVDEPDRKHYTVR